MRIAVPHIVATALVVVALLAAGFCPLTVQLLVLAFLTCRALLPEGRVLEHMAADGGSEDGGSEDGGAAASLVPPQTDKLTHRVELGGGGLLDARSVPDDASGTAFTGGGPNPKPDALVLRERWTGASSEDAGVFEDFTIAVSVTLPEGCALSLFRAQGLSGSGGLAAVDLSVGPGAAGRRQLTLTYGDAVARADVTATREPVTLIARRDKGAATATLLQCTHSVKSPTERESRELSAATLVTPLVKTPVQVAADGVTGGEADLVRVLVWHTALPDRDLDEVCAQGLRAQLLREPVYAALVRKRDAAVQAALAARTRNPFGSDSVQARCASVKDWTLPGALAGADAGCWDAVAAHCRDDPTAPGCECWSPARAGTPACVKFLATLSKEAPVSLGNLSAAQLGALKKRYGLQARGGRERRRAPPPRQRAPPPPRPLPLPRPRPTHGHTGHADLDAMEERLRRRGDGYGPQQRLWWHWLVGR